MNFLPFGAIDIGSNAIRLLIMNAIEYPDETKFKKVSLIRIPLRLGADVFKSKVISPFKCEQLIHAMEGYQHIMQAYNILSYRACATSAMREAKNGHELISEIRDKIGIDLEIITGKEEAEIIFNTGIAQMLDSEKDYLYVDVGGGSTEVTVVSKSKKVEQESFNIGTVRMLNQAVDAKEVDRFKSFMRKQATKLKDTSLIGSGGNINKLFKLMGKKYGETINPSELKHIYDYLKRFTFEERISVLRLNPHRADVIVPATKIFLWAFKHSNSKRVFVPRMGLSDGMVQQLYAKFREKNPNSVILP
ncbi:MAG: exopolyphosphatase [Salinivirgaceae bacterium]|nr:MAG: exopolyphosphatase [Salinivirgaceae bacterium]